MATSDYYSDTSPEAMEVFLDVQRRMSPAQKIALVFSYTRTLFRMMEANVRALYPMAEDREIFLRVTARHLDRDTMIRVYQWDPEMRCLLPTDQK